MNNLKKLSYPYIVWMSILVVVPTLLIVLLSFTNIDVFNLESFSFTLDSLSYLKRPDVVEATKNSIRLSFYTTVSCLLIGYPVAYYLANMKSRNKQLFVALIIIPVWSNMLLRIIAWEKLFYPSSILNMFGISLDLIGTDTAIVIGMVSMYLPFMILPIYSVLDKMDKSLIEASRDLGANTFNTFIRVVFPLSLSGVLSGVLMTLLPSMTAFALPERLSGGKTLLIGNVIEDYFMKTGNINAGSLISVILMLVITFLFIGLLKFDKEGDTLL